MTAEAVPTKMSAGVGARRAVLFPICKLLLTLLPSQPQVRFGEEFEAHSEA